MDVSVLGRPANTGPLAELQLSFPITFGERHAFRWRTQGL